MNSNTENKLLRIFTSNTDKYEHKPLYEVIVHAAKKQGIAGATVIKGIMSYGASSIINSQKLFEITEKLPIIIEIIDESNKILQFYENIQYYFEKIEKGILVTIEDVNVVLYKSGKKN